MQLLALLKFSMAVEVPAEEERAEGLAAAGSCWVSSDVLGSCLLHGYGSFSLVFAQSANA